MSRWPFRAATNKGVAPLLLILGFTFPALRWLFQTAANSGVHPWKNSGSSVFAPASSNSPIGWTCPCIAAWNKGVLPSLSASLGFRGRCSNCSRATELFSLDEIILCVSLSSVGQNSKTTSWIFSGAGSRTSSWISCKLSSTYNLCVNLELPTLAPNFAAKAFFTVLAVWPWSSSSRTVRLSPDVRKHTSVHSSIAALDPGANVYVKNYNVTKK